MGSDELVLAVDPGLSCGWAIGVAKPQRLEASGRWRLPSGPHKGERVRALHGCLRELFKARTHSEEFGDFGAFRPIRLVVYETPFFKSKGQMESHQRLVAAILLFACSRDIDILEVTPAELKKHATGRGDADKISMVRMAKRFKKDLGIDDHDEADAIHLWDYGVQHLKALKRGLV